MSELKRYEYRSPEEREAALARVPQVELAHQPLDISNARDREFLGQVSGITRTSSAEAWINVRRTPEVRYALERSKRIAGYAQFRGVQSDLAGRTTDVAERGIIAEEVSRMTSRFGGTRGLVERFYALRKVTGEMYLIEYRDKPDDEFADGLWFLSPSEIQNEQNSKDGTAKPLTWITAPLASSTGTKSLFERQVEPKDFIGRLWQPDDEYTVLATSPMASLNDLCGMLNQLTESIKGRIKSRFMMDGILAIPSEISDAAFSVSNGPREGLYATDKVLNYLVHVFTTNLASLSNARDRMPILVKGPADVLDKIRFIFAESGIAETDLALRQELINRILDGLDQQKNSVNGGGEMNHWGMWAVSDEERRIAVQPDLDSLCHALTRLVLWRNLKLRNWPDEKIRRWRVEYDLSASAVRSNMSEDARQLHDRGGVNLDFLRSVLGATDQDKMSDLEYTNWLGIKLNNPALALHGRDPGVDWEKVEKWGGKTGPGADSPGDSTKSGPGVGDPGSPSDRDSDTPSTQEPG